MQRAELRFDDGARSLTAAWKAFEEEVRERYGYADLVQLSGYYSYTPKLSATLVKAPEESDLWSLLGAIMAGRGVGVTAPLKQLAPLWGLESGGVALRGLLQKARALGFEVRSSRTNSQIPRGRYLVPYAFPTFTPESVQRRKSF
jgi:DNA (cytosine-5)-methyltransferase 1